MENSKDFSSIGEVIKAVRQEKGISQAELIDRTLISAEFLDNLEELRYGSLPSVPYSLGLIENLLEALSLDRTEIDDLLQKAEQELLLKVKNGVKKAALNAVEGGKGEHAGDIDTSDISAVTEKRNVQMLAWILGTSLVVLLLFFYSFFEIRGAMTEKKRERKLLGESESESENEEKREAYYSLYERFDTFNLNVGDKVRIFLSEKDVIEFTLRGITDEHVSFDLGSFKNSSVSVKKGIIFDLDQDGKDDISIKYQKMVNDQALLYFEMLYNREDKVDFENLWKKFEHVKVGRSYTLIKNSSNRFLIEVFIKAMSLPVYLSYNLDGTRQATKTLNKGEHILITARDHLQVQVGNYRTAIFILNKNPIDLTLQDSKKYSITKIIKWLPGTYSETKSDLVIQDYTE